MENILNNSLANILLSYHNSGIYPFHMPGHKRNFPEEIQKYFKEIMKLDITEVEGMDCLHTASGILKEAQDFLSKVYDSKKSFFLVNGSTCGNLAAIRSVMQEGRKKVLISANAHISGYHAIEICGLEAIKLSPERIMASSDNAMQGIILEGGISFKDLKEKLEKYHTEISMVFMTSPTYEGILSDIQKIANLTHQYQIPLIVDEAHGAHLHFVEKVAKEMELKKEKIELPRLYSALDLGADIVIQSVHKTLPAFTQTAILHIGKNSNIDSSILQYNLSIFETSSPSYILMASIDLSIRIMERYAKVWIVKMYHQVVYLYQKILSFKTVYMVKHLQVWEEKKEKGPLLDFSKLIFYIYYRGKFMLGKTFQKILREEYQIEMEMAGTNYILGILTVCDTWEGIEKLVNALQDIDKRVHNGEWDKAWMEKMDKNLKCIVWGENRIVVKDIMGLVGQVANRDIYIFPPDIPLVEKGEKISQEIVEKILMYLQTGHQVYGIEI